MKGKGTATPHMRANLLYAPIKPRRRPPGYAHANSPGTKPLDFDALSEQQQQQQQQQQQGLGTVVCSLALSFDAAKEGAGAVESSNSGGGYGGVVCRVAMKGMEAAGLGEDEVRGFS